MRSITALYKSAYRNRICLLSFLLPFFSMLAIFIGNGIYPFGDGSFMHSDMYHQYVPFLREFLRKIHDGDSLFYSWNIGMGANYLALFIYYCASPFNWLMLLFPVEYLIEFMSYMVIFKIGLCGFTFAYYLKRRFRTDSLLIVLFSLFYALSGFTAAYNWNVMWMDCLFLTPLILLGLERLMKERKCGLYCICLSLSILTNYYLSIMICIFLCLYALLLLPEVGAGQSAKQALLQRAKALLSFAFYSLLAGGMAAILLLPELYALRATKFTAFHFPKEVKFYFPFLDMIARHALCVETEAGLDHWPNLFCSCAVFFLIPLYIYNKSIPLLQKLGRLLLCAFLLLSFSTNILNFIWHGFNYPDSLPARQSFLYIFLILTMCFEAVYKKEGYRNIHLLNAFTLGFGFLILAQKVVDDDAFSTVSFLTSMGFLSVYALLLHAYKKTPCPSISISAKRWILPLLALAIVTLEATFNMAYTSVSTTSRSKYLANLPAYEALVARTRLRDTDFYRFEKSSRVTKNDGALAGYPTASCFSSTANARIQDWYDRMGMSESKVFYCFDGQTPFTAALLNVRYLFSHSAIEDETLYTLVDREDDIYLYQNRYTLPTGFILEDGQSLDSQKIVESAATPFALQNRLAATFLSPSATNTQTGETQKLFHSISVTENNGKATFTAGTAGHYYAYARRSRVDEVKLESPALNKTFTKVKYDYIMDLGWQETGNNVTLTNQDGGALDLAVCRLDTDTLSQVISALGSQKMTVDSYDSTHLSGHITVQRPGRLLLSVACEPGWKLTVDQKPVEIEAYDNLFLSTPLETGDHTIELTFYPEGLVAGCGISAVSLLLFLLSLLPLHTKKIFRSPLTKSRLPYKVRKED